MRKRYTAVITSSAVLLILALVLFFYFVQPASPLGIYINVHVHCQQTQSPIVGLDVTLYDINGSKIETIPTDKSGKAGPFGSGLVDGTYTIEFFWADKTSYTITINCSKITWDFYYNVDNPKIIKHFFYALNDETTPPVVGLNVTLWKDGSVFDWQLTDASGTVSWIVDVGYDYHMTYLWGSVSYRVPAVSEIHFEIPTCREDLVWEEWNGLQPKSVEAENVNVLSLSSLWLI